MKELIKQTQTNILYLVEIQNKNSSVSAQSIQRNDFL